MGLVFDKAFLQTRALKAILVFVSFDGSQLGGFLVMPFWQRNRESANQLDVGIFQLASRFHSAKINNWP